MLEGKELEGKLGEYGSYAVDVKADGTVEGDLSGQIEKSFGSWLKVKGQLTGGVELDLVGGLVELTKDSKSEILKGLVASIAKALGK